MINDYCVTRRYSRTRDTDFIWSLSWSRVRTTERRSEKTFLNFTAAWCVPRWAVFYWNFFTVFVYATVAREDNSPYTFRLLHCIADIRGRSVWLCEQYNIVNKENNLKRFPLYNIITYSNEIKKIYLYNITIFEYCTLSYVEHSQCIIMYNNILFIKSCTWNQTIGTWCTTKFAKNADCFSYYKIIIFFNVTKY